MPDFSAPEYRSYISLCRELRLDPPEHGYRPSDLFVPADPADGDEPVSMHGMKRRRNYVRFLSLADWLDMLDAADHTDVAIETWGEEWSVKTPFETGESTRGVGPTREEAIAHLALTLGAVKVRQDA